jgi:uncharacterized membrane protein YbhN (UPF0104 family)
VSQVVDAARTFFQHLAAVGWTALGIGLLFHLLRLLARIPAWRNILRAAYPQSRVPRRGVTGAYLAGVGVNSILPARSGDLLRLYLVKRRIEGSTYPTLGATLVVETLFDTVVAGVILLWALVAGLLPALNVLPHLPSIDWHWPLQHPKLAAAIAAVWIVALAILGIAGVRKVRGFRQRVRQGFAILARPRRFLAGVVTWQAASWVFRYATVYAFLRAFHVPATAHNALLVLVVQSLATLFPFTPGGVGTQQGLLVYVFRGESISKTSLLSFSIGMQVATAVLSALLGFASILLMLRTLRWRKLVVADEQRAYAREG